MKILIYGAGYVGLANGLALARKNEVTIFDINKGIINQLSNGISHIDDNDVKNEIITTDAQFIDSISDLIIDSFDLVILALPTNFNDDTNEFDVSSLMGVFGDINVSNNKNIDVLIKSTVPIGFTEMVNNKFDNVKVSFAPEFLREGSSLADATHPSRIVVGSNTDLDIANIFLGVSENYPAVILTSSSEAEAIKLFANTYLAMRVSFVNELSNFAHAANLDESEILSGLASDNRIGKQYFSPSSGYGGYCLPKDSKQLMNEFSVRKIKSEIIPAIVKSNSLRKKTIVDNIVKSGIKKIKINGIGHKKGVTNYRNSTNLDIAIQLREKDVYVEIVDTNFTGEVIKGFAIKSASDIKNKLIDFI